MIFVKAVINCERKGNGDNLLAHTSSNTIPGNFVSTSVDKNIAPSFKAKDGKK